MTNIFYSDIIKLRGGKIMKLDCELVEKLSKQNKPYFCIVIHLTENLDKLVFLTQAELEIIRLNSDNF